MFKFNFILNAVAVVLLLLVPSWVYENIFGGVEFGMVSVYIAWLAVGIFMLGTSTSVSAYFAARGKYWPAVVSSFLGGLVTLAVCEFFMEGKGVIAAAAGASLSYSVILVYFVWCFLKEEKLNLSDVLPRIKELKLYYRWLRGGLYKWNSR